MPQLLEKVSMGNLSLRAACIGSRYTGFKRLFGLLFVLQVKGLLPSFFHVLAKL